MFRPLLERYPGAMDGAVLLGGGIRRWSPIMSDGPGCSSAAHF